MRRKKDLQILWDLGFETIRELETDMGIMASSSQEIYGCIFGRDSLITSLKLLRASETSHNEYFLPLVRKVLINLAILQGKEVNVESGEQPGKIIHEFRPDNHDHLTKEMSPAWYVYPDNVMRNYDSVDSTALFLMTVYRYYELSDDQELVTSLKPNIEAALNWILEYGDSNGDGFIDYTIPEGRTCGGLVTHNWMDSTEAIFHENGEAVVYPIAPVEVQAYTYAALRMWADHFETSKESFALTLTERANELKKLFNEKYITSVGWRFNMASAIDGTGRPMAAIRSSMGHVLWAAHKRTGDIEADSILNSEYIPSLVRRLMRKDLFEPKAGIRTLSKKSNYFAAVSYHNGSIWPHDSGIISEGLEKFGYIKEARRIQRAIAHAITHVSTPIELLSVVDGEIFDGQSETGQQACKKQAWSAATLLSEFKLLEPKRRLPKKSPIQRDELIV